MASARPPLMWRWRRDAAGPPSSSSPQKSRPAAPRLAGLQVERTDERDGAVAASRAAPRAAGLTAAEAVAVADGVLAARSMVIMVAAAE